jgi:hypothetical protein
VVAGIGTRAEQTIDRQVLKDLTRVRGKNRLLYAVAEAALAHPDEVVRTVVYPAAGGEQTLRDLVTEYQATDSYERQIQRTMRRTYGHHYRRMLPNLLRVLTFRSNNTVHRPVIRAIDLLIRYADRTQLHYDVSDNVPITGVVPSAWRDLVEQTNTRGVVQVNRMTYELCALQAIREQLRCREIWVEGANRFRNPDDDLPRDFDAGRSGYYAALRLPTEVETFIAQEQAALRKALTTGDLGNGEHGLCVGLQEIWGLGSEHLDLVYRLGGQATSGGGGQLGLFPRQRLARLFTKLREHGLGVDQVVIEDLAGDIEQLKDHRVANPVVDGCPLFA